MTIGQSIARTITQAQAVIDAQKAARTAPIVTLD
jgi:hypothetical protein